MKAAPDIRVVNDRCVLCNDRCKNPQHWPKHVTKSCIRKRGYTSLMDAMDMAILARQTFDHAHVYLCPLEDHWHITTKRYLLRPQSDLTHISEVLDDMGLGGPA